MNFKSFFHYVSYLQYPLMLAAVFFVVKPYFNGLEYVQSHPEVIAESLNSLLIFMGLGVSFSSLQDTTKTQNKMSKKIWQDPKKGKILISVITLQILAFLALGLLGYYFSKEGLLKELSIGLIVFSLGMFGFLKAAIEMFENHRLDRVQDIRKEGSNT